MKSALHRWPPESFSGLPNPDMQMLHLTAPTRKDQFHGGTSRSSQARSKAITQSNTKSPLHFLVFSKKLLSTAVVRPFRCQSLFSKGRQVSLCEKGVALRIVTAGEALLKATCQHNQSQQWQKRGRREESSVCRRRAGNRGPLEGLSAANGRPRTPHHPPPGGERRGKRKRLMMFLERTREGHHQSDKCCGCFKGSVGETAERLGAFPSTQVPYWAELNWTIKTIKIPSRTELNWTIKVNQ